MSKPYRFPRIGILNHEGEVWSRETFDTPAGAQAYIDAYQRRNPGMDLSKHRPAPVRVTISAATPPRDGRPA